MVPALRPTIDKLLYLIAENLPFLVRGQRDKGLVGVFLIALRVITNDSQAFVDLFKPDT
jgi:hypothetical protein